MNQFELAPATKAQQPRGPRTGAYQKVNAYTQPYSKQQIITLLLFIIQLALHSVFIVPPLTKIRTEILYVLFGFHYLFLLIIAYDYIYLTVSDPVDSLILNPKLSYSYCNSQRQKHSHHCMRCNRCTEEFDHHCKFLNNCIGSKNYESFIRILFFYLIYCLNIIGQGVWVIINNFQNQELAFSGSKWGTLATIIITAIILVPVIALFVFHIYITLYENTTTFTHMYPEQSTEDNQTKKKGNQVKKNFINFFEPPNHAKSQRKQENLVETSKKRSDNKQIQTNFNENVDQPNSAKNLRREED